MRTCIVIYKHDDHENVVVSWVTSLIHSMTQGSTSFWCKSDQSQDWSFGWEDNGRNAVMPLVVQVQVRFGGTCWCKIWMSGKTYTRVGTTQGATVWGNCYMLACHHCSFAIYWENLQTLGSKIHKYVLHGGLLLNPCIKEVAVFLFF